MDSTPVFVLLSMLTLIALSRAAPADLTKLRHTLILSMSTGRFLRFNADGNVYADGLLDTTEAKVFMRHFSDNRVAIESANRACHLIFENGTFQCGLPSNNNEVFELVTVFSNRVAFRVEHRSLDASQSGSGDLEVEKRQVEITSEPESDETTSEQVESDESNEVTSECYLGFDVTGGPAGCYEAADIRATLFWIIEDFF